MKKLTILALILGASTMALAYQRCVVLEESYSEG